jgi:hypothetical protein
MQLFTNTYRSVSNLSVLSVFVLFFANKCVSVVHTSPTRNRKSPSLSSIWVKVVLSSREIRTYQFEEDKKNIFHWSKSLLGLRVGLEFATKVIVFSFRCESSNQILSISWIVLKTMNNKKFEKSRTSFRSVHF